MDLTAYGYKVPESPDTGETFFPNLKFNWERISAHSHNGTDSALLAINGIVVATSTILAASWSADGSTGTYKQTITLPSVGVTPVQLDFDNIAIQFKDTTTGERAYPKVLKVTDGTYDVYVNDNTAALTAIYTT